MNTIFLGVFITALVAIAMPLGFAIILAGLMVIWIDGGINPVIVAQRVYAGMNSFSLLAIPFFLLAGSLMSASGMTRRLIDFANALVGRHPGGLAMSNITASTFFGGISGSAVADTSMLGRIFIPEMKRLGYSGSFSAAVTAASSVVAPIIPPSIAFIVYGVITEQSITRLFIAGIGPGILYTLAALILTAILARRRNFPVHQVSSFREMLRAGFSAAPALMMPVLILIGIFGGIFTITEASAVAALYALFVGTVVYRELTVAGILAAMRETAETTAAIMIIVGAAQLFAWILAYAQIPRMAVDAISTIGANPLLFLLLVNLLLLIVGTFMEANAAMVMLVPILHPAAMALGIDETQFGVIVVVNLCLGLITPPIGLCLNVACKIGNVPLEKSLPDVIPFLGVGVLLLVALSLFPSLTLIIPSLFYGS
ncbi:TRAP transporter large permease [Roseovarius gahaiensis]|uniref:TRAP transporter large permease protein n=1 Tax=Roseovarius gahaiensis TaxID=2716691 RepID=A0A967BFV9_9RHOB|nr:TRAP transporter large permease [Roseovarius gahaiensis]NHQ75311.1 TRAP transporter large permease [Roseovarius gahaiensis]